jgi:hypothetical protein
LLAWYGVGRIAPPWLAVTAGVVVGLIVGLVLTSNCQELWMMVIEDGQAATFSSVM